MAALYILVTVAALSGLGILLVRTVLNAALSLIVCLLAIAAIYIVLGAEFLAVVQILVYAGGILLLIIFGIMVTTRPRDVRPSRKWPAFLLTALLAVMFWLGLQSLDTPGIAPSNATVSTFGVELMTQYAAPFEFAGVLVLISMIGAMITASFQSKSNER